MRRFFIFSIIFLAFAFSDAHDIHISKCMMKYSEENESLQLSMHLFLDDLELALAERGHENLKLCTEYEHPSADSLVAAFIEDHFHVVVGEEQLSHDFIGKEISEDLIAVWCYVEIEFKSIPESMDIRYDVFTEMYDDQSNILSFRTPSAKRELIRYSRKRKSEKINL